MRTGMAPFSADNGGTPLTCLVAVSAIGLAWPITVLTACDSKSETSTERILRLGYIAHEIKLGNVHWSSHITVSFCAAPL